MVATSRRARPTASKPRRVASNSAGLVWEKEVKVQQGEKSSGSDLREQDGFLKFAAGPHLILLELSQVSQDGFWYRWSSLEF